ncbi:MAG: hypothetical protein LBD80_03240 [Tannerella sp.]|nr:hypothetical protein [Tannerella sp.]
MAKEGKREGAKANPPMSVIANPQGEAMTDMHIIICTRVSVCPRCEEGFQGTL